jgi:replication-associated recombination protein RarA
MKKNNLKNLVFWEKYKPTLLKKGKGIPIILLPRIRNIVDGLISDDGEIELKMNMLLFGSGGIGKSSLLNILTENTDFMKLKSTERGVDTIELIEEHCKNFTLPVKKKNQKGNPQGQKVIWLEEFDMTSVKFRQALRSFMDDYPNIRFVATANNISQISRSDEDIALMSRFNLIDFDPETTEEVKFLKNQYFRYLKAVGKNSKI